MNTTEPNELSLDNIQEEVARILTEPKSIMLKERLQREWDAVPTFNLPIDAPAEAVAEKALELGDYASNIFDIEPPTAGGSSVHHGRSRREPRHCEGIHCLHAGA